jgi:hypothetical protein
MNEADRQALVQSLIEARKKLEYEIHLQYSIAKAAMAKAQEAEEQDKFLIGMLGQYGHVESQAPVQRPALAPLPISANPTQDEVAVRWIVEYGASDAARRWCEWLLAAKIVPSPSPVAMFYDRFPQTLKQQYNDDRNKAIEALRAQFNSWIEKGQTTIRYMNAKVHAAQQEEESA